MSKRRIATIGVLCCFMMISAGNGLADLVRSSGGSWHETNNTWRVGSVFTDQLPDVSDAIQLYSTEDAIIDLYEGAVSVKSLSIGQWGGASKMVTLLVRNDLSTVNAISISITGNLGGGAMIVSNATVSSTSTTQIGTTSDGLLTIDGGGIFQNTAWRVSLGAYATVTVNDGTLSMKNALVMADGSRLDINGSSEVWIWDNDQTQEGDLLMQYIHNGWIAGNGIVGNVDVTYDGSKTIVTAVPLGNASVSRAASGSWHDTLNTWKTSSGYIYRTPVLTDAITLTSTENATVTLYEDSVEVRNMTLGSWGGAEKTVTLLVNTNLSTVDGGLSIASTGNIGSGAMIISNATVSTIGTTLIGKTSSGSLTVNDGGLFENTAWRIDLGSNAVVTVNDGTVSMQDRLLMEEGGQVDINGDSQLWIEGMDETQSEDLLMQYISSGWIYGNGVAGNVDVTYDGSKTIVTAALPKAHLSISCSSSNAVLTSVDLSTLALSNVLQKCSVLGDEWIDILPVSTGTSSNSWTVSSEVDGEFFRIRSWF